MLVSSLQQLLVGAPRVNGMSTKVTSNCLSNIQLLPVLNADLGPGNFGFIRLDLFAWHFYSKMSSLDLVCMSCLDLFN